MHTYVLAKRRMMGEVFVFFLPLLLQERCRGHPPLETKALERKVAAFSGVKSATGGSSLPVKENYLNCLQHFIQKREERDIRSRSVWHLRDSAPLDNTGI